MELIEKAEEVQKKWTEEFVVANQAFAEAMGNAAEARMEEYRAQVERNDKIQRNVFGENAEDKALRNWKLLAPFRHESDFNDVRSRWLAAGLTLDEIGIFAFVGQVPVLPTMTGVVTEEDEATKKKKEEASKKSEKSDDLKKGDVIMTVPGTVVPRTNRPEHRRKVSEEGSAFDYLERPDESDDGILDIEDDKVFTTVSNKKRGKKRKARDEA